MPVYNGEEFLRAAIDSLLAQTFRDFELIISDNASTDADFDRDGVPDVLATRGRASEHNPRFVWARNDGKGSFKIYDNIPATDGDLLQGVTVGRFSCGNLSIALSWHQANRGVQMLTVPRDPRTERWHWQRIAAVSQDEQLRAGLAMSFPSVGVITKCSGTKTSVRGAAPKQCERRHRGRENEASGGM